MAINPSGKVQEVLGGNLRLPAVCLLCGAGAIDTERIFLDLNVDIDEYGSLYFCVPCGGEVGNAAGMTNTALFNTEVARRTLLEEENEELSKALTQMGDLVENDILRYLAARDSRVTSSPSIVSIEVDEPDIEDEFLFDADLNGDSGDDSDASTGESSEGTESLEPIESNGPDDFDEPTDSDITYESKSYVPKLEL